MARYLDPKNDLTFKRVFGEHPDLVIDFLNSIMPLSENNKIKEIEYLPAELVPDTPNRKNSIVDVRCKDKNGQVFIVEMQMLWTSDFMNRIVFNASKAYVRQLDKNKSYHLLQPVYTLAILNQNFDNKTENCYHHYSIVNRENTEEVIEGLQFVLIELQKFKPENMSDRKMAVLWLKFLRDVDESMTKLPEDLASNEQIRKAAELCEEGALTPREFATYEAYWDIIRTELTLREGSLAEGLAKGKAEGLAEGKAKGLAEGLAEGEAKKTKEMVINCHKAKIDIETIATITNLTITQVTEILKNR